MRSLLFLVCLGLHLGMSNLFAQPLDTLKLNQLFDQLQAKDKAMGSITISKNGKLLYERSIGYSFISEEEKIKATADTKYRIGSITKMFTAVMIFQLIEEGKLNLATTIDYYFPELPHAKQITIADLLNHRSGLYNYTNRSDYELWSQTARTHKEMLTEIKEGKVNFLPGEKSSYSNSNYIILGYLIEEISKQSYAKNLHKRITSKINLSNTYAGGKADIKKGESFSYVLDEKFIQKPNHILENSGGAGCIVSTPEDLALFIEALFSLQLVSESSLTQMKTIVDGYGMGMTPYSFYNQKGYGHGGLTDAFYSMLYYYPDDSLVIAYCSNGQFYPIHSIVFGVLSICFHNEEYIIPTFEKYPVKIETLNSYVGKYTSKESTYTVEITTDNSILFEQALDKPRALLQVAENKFVLDSFGYAILEFNANEQMVWKQGGKIYHYNKVQ